MTHENFLGCWVKELSYNGDKKNSHSIHFIGAYDPVKDEVHLYGRKYTPSWMNPKKSDEFYEKGYYFYSKNPNGPWLNYNQFVVELELT